MATSLPMEAELTETSEDVLEERPYIVLVWNDPINLMPYVTYVLQKVFGYSEAKANKMMRDVHEKGRAVVANGTRSEAERYVNQLHAHGLWATLEQDK